MSRETAGEFFMNKTGNFSKVQRMVILAVLIALTLVMALTPLGYLKIGALSISFLAFRLQSVQPFSVLQQD